jgi:hypothetical protein
MTSEIQIHTIARQMLERHGPGAIAQAAQNAVTCEHMGQLDEASEWQSCRRRHEDHARTASKLMH